MAEYLMKRVGDSLYPCPEYADDFNKFVKLNTEVSVEMKHKRGLKFQRKFIVMIKLGYDNWNPKNAEAAKKMGVPVGKSFEVFRKDVIIAAGFHTSSFGLDGEVKLVADSIKFSRMDEDEFNKVYNACNQVLLDLVYAYGTTEEDINRQVEELLRF